MCIVNLLQIDKQGTTNKVLTSHMCIVNPKNISISIIIILYIFEMSRNILKRNILKMLITLKMSIIK